MERVYQLLAGGIGVSIVSGVFMIIQMRMTKSAAEKVESKKLTEGAFDKLASRLEAVEASNADMKAASLALTRDRLLSLARGYLLRGSVTLEERQSAMALYEVYGERLGGNGSVKSIIRRVEELPLSKRGD